MQMAAWPCAAGQERWFVRDGRPSRTGAACAASRGFSSYRSGKDEGRRIVAGET